MPIRIFRPMKVLCKDNLKGQRAILAMRSGHAVRALAGTVPDGDPPQSVAQVPSREGEDAGTARPHLLRISSARKSVVAVAGEAIRLPKQNCAA